MSHRQHPTPRAGKKAASQAVRLSGTDIETLKAKACLDHPGIWLHHFPRLLEEEVLRRNAIPFTPQYGVIPS